MKTRPVQQINAPKPPIWRDPVHLRRQAREARLRPVLLLLSLLVGLLLALPPDGAYDEAISMQLARGAPTAWALFVAMGATLGYLAVRLWKWENRVGAVAASAVVVGLGVISATSPTSYAHQQTFMSMTGLILMGHFGFLYGHLDLRLVPTAALATLGALLCFGHLGLGERLLIASSLAALNLLVYGHLEA